VARCRRVVQELVGKVVRIVNQKSIF
jgi:hypothetical protein